MAVDLVFAAPPIVGPPYRLVFGATGEAVTPAETLTLQAALPGVALLARLTVGYGLALQTDLPGLALRARLTEVDRLTLQATLPGLALAGRLDYDNRVTRYLHRPALAPQQVAAPIGQAIGGAWQTARSEQVGTAAGWRLAR